MALIVNVFQFNGFQENTYLVSNDNKETLIFDPGCYSREEEHLLSDFIEKNKFNSNFSSPFISNCDDCRGFI